MNKKATKLSDSHPLVYCMLNILMYNLLVLVKKIFFFFFFFFFFLHLSGTHDERFSELSPVSCATSKTYGLGSDKRYLRGIKVKIKIMNISWKFEELILINNKAMSIRTCVCNAFLNMTSLTLIITFWRQQRCVNIFLRYVHAKNNNPRNLFEGIYFTFYWK